MSEERKYNGWNTYETWLVNVWLTNEEWSSEELERIVAEVKDEVDPEDRVEVLAGRLESWVDSEPDEGGLIPQVKGLAGDLMRGALREVDWRELAKNWLEEGR
jgi:hypothetical protein